tara:strand:- start:260 stop:511 length:252 start_codon:yes stop_codon:yes gene_type:complete
MDMGLRKELREFVQWQKERKLLKDPLTIDYELAESYLERNMYSEDEVIHIIDQTVDKFYKHYYSLTKAEMKKDWFNQIKRNKL